jgi:hypothetical protein
MQMPIIDLSDSPVTMGQIDWNQPQPDGTYRCVEGWEAGSYQFGCLKRATTETDDRNLRCTEHALLYELRVLRYATQDRTAAATEAATDQTAQIDSRLSDITVILEDMNYTLMPLYRKLWYRVLGWRQQRKQARQAETNRHQMHTHANDLLGDGELTEYQQKIHDITHACCTPDNPCRECQDRTEVIDLRGLDQ